MRVLFVLCLAACSGTTNGRDGSVPPDFASSNRDMAVLPGSPAMVFTEKLGGGHAGHFLVGMGNDGTNSGNDDAYNLGVTLDLHYHYIVGLSTEGGWPTWNSNPDYVGKRIREAKSHGVVPMFTYYAMASHGDGNLTVLQDSAFMATYFTDLRQALNTIATEGGPVVLHHEPDFWGYTQKDGTSPDSRVVLVSQSNAAECAGMPDTLTGFGHCLVAMTRARAPNALIGFHASAFSSNMDIDKDTSGLNVAAEAAKTVAFFQKVGLDAADFVGTDVSDRDAGCYEANHMPMCACDQVSPGVCQNYYYWDETNTVLPNFHRRFVWDKAISDGLGLPVIWWQLPFGEPSTTPGGTVGAWRDNRVHYLFGHVDELVAAGGVGMVYGTGSGDQTYLPQSFKTAVTTYFASPFALQ
jgi:hypothetical protein